MHGTGHGHNRAGNTSKRDLLKMELDFRDIEMDMLPVGMEKRTLSQSTWDATYVFALHVYKEFVPITVLSSNIFGDLTDTTLLFSPSSSYSILPPDPYAPSNQPPEPPFRYLTHRNGLNETISQCIQARLTERAKSKKEKQTPPWLHEQVIPDSSDPDAFQPPTCVMPTLLDPLASLQSRPSALRPGHITRHGHYKLGFDDTLEAALKNKQFVEYPTIEIWEKDAFTGTIVDVGGAVMLGEGDERKPKRRKLGVKEGKKAITGLLGDYGSDKEDGEVQQMEEEKNVFDMLAGYAESDEEEAEKRQRLSLPSHLDGNELGDEDAEGETDDEMDYEDEAGEETSAEELVTMLQKLRGAGALRDPAGEGRLPGSMEYDDRLDWGDSEDEA